MATVKTLSHLGYDITIDGKYKKKYGIEFEGNIYYGGVELSYKIIKDGDLISLMDVEDLLNEVLSSKLDVRAFIVKRGYIYTGKFLKKTVGITRLEDELEHSLILLTDYIKTEINRREIKRNTAECEKYITDGLPESLKKLD